MRNHMPRYDYRPPAVLCQPATVLESIDTRGAYVLEPRRDAIFVFQGALAYTETAEGKMGYIDRTGKSVWTEP
jgi:hypothetical protein